MILDLLIVSSFWGAIVYLFGCIVVAHIAEGNGRNHALWFFGSIALTPFFMVLALIAAGKKERRQKSP